SASSEAWAGDAPDHSTCQPRSASSRLVVCSSQAPAVSSLCSAARSIATAPPGPGLSASRRSRLSYRSAIADRVHPPPASTSSRSPWRVLLSHPSITIGRRMPRSAGGAAGQFPSSLARFAERRALPPPEGMCSGGTAAQPLAQLLDLPGGAGRERIERECRLEAAQCGLRLPEPLVDQAVAGQGAGMARLQCQRLLNVQDRGLPVAHQKMHGRALVPALRKLGCLLDHAIEGLKRRSVALILHRKDALLHEPVEAGIVRLQPDPPDMLLDQAGLRRTGGGPKTFAQTVEAR